MRCRRRCAAARHGRNVKRNPRRLRWLAPRRCHSPASAFPAFPGVAQAV